MTPEPEWLKLASLPSLFTTIILVPLLFGWDVTQRPRHVPLAWAAPTGLTVLTSWILLAYYWIWGPIWLPDGTVLKPWLAVGQMIVSAIFVTVPTAVALAVARVVRPSESVLERPEAPGWRWLPVVAGALVMVGVAMTHDTPQPIAKPLCLLSPWITAAGLTTLFLVRRDAPRVDRARRFAAELILVGLAMHLAFILVHVVHVGEPVSRTTPVLGAVAIWVAVVGRARPRVALWMGLATSPILLSLLIRLPYQVS